ncbi:hypothetical protein A3842_02895 [Paenibacillus sp. P3E]|uniref:hypothetical protein n=1 Tax=Paenibacillus sp. P3E TaxID=1349435 RepID=UPI00093C5E90|nr:hypothetical protein [Paenibacillus sp. P3E]OKP91511.1 hypothetical protein A3842_02895 [Paenibacillus sp. P3E]
MSFDWGGFAGGIVGTMGAFGAAWYTFWKQKRNERPGREKKRLELISVIRSTLDKHWWSMAGMEAEKVQDVFDKTFEITNEVNNFLGSAIETDSELASLILNIVDGLNILGNDYSRREKTDKNLQSYQDDIWNLLGSKITDCDHLRDIMLKRYQ